MSLTVTDLFCGGGGSSTGLTQIPGFEIVMAANHWPLAVEVHNRNHPDSDHAAVDLHQEDPRFFPKTDVLWASPECTKWSQANGSKPLPAIEEGLFEDPLSDDAATRSRLLMFDVLRFAEHHRYRAMLIENVVDIATQPKYRMAWTVWRQDLRNLGQPVRIDLIHTEGEAEIAKKLMTKWDRHNELVAKMTDLVRERGLAKDAIGTGLRRTRFSAEDRQVRAGDGYELVLNDTVIETAQRPDDSVDLVLTSLPFSTQYEYSPSENDFGHNEDNAAFWAQMDYLTPELLRILKPGRIAAIHVKDRIVPGGMTGLGFQTIYPFSDETVRHFTGHGWAFLARRTIVTDVVRENNQTYRLGWTEQCKDGSRMGAGMPEYLLLFRKPPTDASDGYADQPVVKDKATYTRSRWQTDAHGFWRSNGNRHLTPDEFTGIPHAQMFRLFRDHNTSHVYDYEDHVAIGEHLEEKRLLPTTFMLLQPPSWHPDVWTDVARMRTLNMVQQRKGFAQHLCPLQFDIVDRVITQHTMPGETVYDPFGGIMTVPYCALKLDRHGVGVELNPDYWRDGVHHVEGIARDQAAPTLFDLDSEDGAA